MILIQSSKNLFYCVKEKGQWTASGLHSCRNSEMNLKWEILTWKNLRVNILRRIRDCTHFGKNRGGVWGKKSVTSHGGPQ